MTNDMFILLRTHLGGASANRLNVALSDAESAHLYDELNQIEGGIDDPDRPPELTSWKKWTNDELIEYAKRGVVPERFAQTKIQTT